MCVSVDTYTSKFFTEFSVAVVVVIVYKAYLSAWNKLVI